MGRKQPTVSGQLRAAISASKMSRYAMCQRTGLDQAQMSRFMAGKAGLSLDTVDKLAALLGLRLVGRKAGG